MEVGRSKDLDSVDEVLDESVVVEGEEQMQFEDDNAANNSVEIMVFYFIHIYPVFVRRIREFGVGFTVGRKY
jgi:hypothetical protein